MCATLAGTPSLSWRRKSMRRYARLWPPPWCRAVTRPALLRPPLEMSGRTSDFSGSDRVTSTKSATLAPRRPGVVGLYLRIPMSRQSLSCRSRSGDRASEDVDALAVGDAHDRPLGVGPAAVPEARAAPLALAVERVDAGHRHAEHLLDGDLDLGLVGVRTHDERVLVLVEEPVALLRDHRREQHVARVGDPHDALPSSVVSTSAASDSVATAFADRPLAGPARNASSAPFVKTTSSETRTS